MTIHEISERAPRLSYTIQETAEMLGVSRDTVRRAIAREELRVFLLGTRVLVRADSLRALLDRRGDELDGR